MDWNYMKFQRLPLASQHQETSGRERKEQDLPMIPDLKCTVTPFMTPFTSTPFT